MANAHWYWTPFGCGGFFVNWFVEMVMVVVCFKAYLL